VSDIKLFRITDGKTVELDGGSFKLEKELQTMVEQHMEPFLGVRFLASEYSTGKTHRGRIDSLGLDENNTPVIVEYKRHSSENVINQGLFYLDWLLDHQAEFQMLVLDQLGSDAVDKVDWSAPRLLCIGADFTRYDEHAVQQIDRDIDLLRYRIYGNEFVVLELVNSVTSSDAPTGPGGTGKSSKVATYKTVSQYLEGSAQGLKDLYAEVRDHLLSLGEDVQEKVTLYYFAFKRIRNFACVEVHTREVKLLVHLKVDPDSLDLEADFTRDVRKIGHFGTGDLEVTLRSSQDLERAKPLILRSYEAS
jgi:predicted transport protein|tara:strand:- start:292 stop:1209 length:918 start_codon:yes stop_codon:yes gene_type:complete